MSQSIYLDRVLLTNDDGIDAPGLDVLSNIAAELAKEVWIIAPERDQSGCGMACGLSHIRRIRALGPRRFAVDGTPVDCVAFARHIMQDVQPELVLSGINAGDNLGDCTSLSGTVGAALAALLLGIPSIALSQAYTRDRSTIRWDSARQLMPQLLKTLLLQGWRNDHCLSINIPDQPQERIKRAVWTRLTPRYLTGFETEARTDLRGGAYSWIALQHDTPDQLPDDSDLAAVLRGDISITCLALDRSRDAEHDSITFD